jgi:hypothetical protein
LFIATWRFAAAESTRQPCASALKISNISEAVSVAAAFRITKHIVLGRN